MRWPQWRGSDRLPSLAWEEAYHLPLWPAPGWLYEHHLPSASCDSVSFAQSCPLPHRSRAMWPTLLSLLSHSESETTRQERFMVEIWGLHTTDQVPWMRVQGAGGPSGQAISDGFFLLGFSVSLRIWATVGESSPSLISMLSRAGGAEADDTGGQGETPVSTVRATCPVDPRSSVGLNTHLHSPQKFARLWTLNLKGQCEVWKL